MPKKIKHIYQIKIVLKGVKPKIWRRIQVPENYSFWDLHVAIQDAMGWTDTHLHQFTIMDPKTYKEVHIGMPCEDDFVYGMSKMLAGWKKKINKYFSITNNRCCYEYDFGDCWEHEITLEKVLPLSPDIQYPICIGGKRACPPEDCGGSHGYENFLEIIFDPKHEEHNDMLKWAGRKFDPEDFDCQEVNFDNPKQRLEYVDFK